MIMCMSKIICVTNRKLAKAEFISQIKKVIDLGVKTIILREKDLSQKEYLKLAGEVLDVCKKENINCIFHNFISVAKFYNHKKIHLPLRVLEQEYKNLKEFDEIGASIHSIEEAKKAESLGATYISAGHIFVTDCKKGLEPRGIEFLENVCKNVNIPVYAIGGINLNNINLTINAGAKGACIMSYFMNV